MLEHQVIQDSVEHLEPLEALALLVSMVKRVNQELKVVKEYRGQGAIQDSQDRMGPLELKAL